MNEIARQHDLSPHEGDAFSEVVTRYLALLSAQQLDRHDEARQYEVICERLIGTMPARARTAYAAYLTAVIGAEE